MHITKFIPALAVPLLAMACSESPTATAADEAPLFSATKGDVLIEGIDDFTDYVKCANDGAGELLHWYGPWRITGTSVTSNSGNVNQRTDLEYLEGYTITGLTSGDVWTVSQSRFNDVTHILKNGNWVRNSSYVETYENQDGDRMFVHTILHFTIANGEWRAFRIAIPSCSLK